MRKYIEYQEVEYIPTDKLYEAGCYGTITLKIASIENKDKNIIVEIDNGNVVVKNLKRKVLFQGMLCKEHATGLTGVYVFEQSKFYLFKELI